MRTLGPISILLIFLSACHKPDLKIGDPAPAWSSIEWLNSVPLKLENINHKLILVRWWTDQCQFCENSADALNEWHEMYADSGLLIIGMYHPKPEPVTCDPEEIRNFVLEKSFRFPIGIDEHWENLKRYWWYGSPKQFTSVSFLIDQHKNIRYIHPGGEYHKKMAEGHESCVKDYHKLEQEIKLALREN